MNGRSKFIPMSKYDSHIHESKITARRCMKAVDVRMTENVLDHTGLPWIVLSDAEARSLAMDLLFTVDREAWLKANDSYMA